MSFDWLRSVRTNAVRRTRRGRTIPTATRIQSLESRVLLTAVATGNEFQVNTTTTAAQAVPAVAMDSDGDYVVAWESNNQDGSGYGIFAQRFNKQGVKQGSEFQVNTFTTGNQRDAAVAMDANGNFVVTWTSTGQNSDGDEIYAQRYNAAGTAQGSEFRVNTVITLGQNKSDVAMDAAGNFVVTWDSDGEDGSNLAVMAQRYNASGVAQGSNFRVNTYTTGAQRFSSVAMDNDGNFVVTWESEQTGGVDFDVYAQRFSAAGTAQGGEFRVNTDTTGAQILAKVDLDATGDFVVAWIGYSASEDGSGFGIYAQRFNNTGTAQGGELLVNTYTTGNQALPVVAVDADGDFVVSWVSTNQDGDGYGVFAQQYNAAGTKQGTEVQVNTATLSNQSNPAVAMDANGNFVVAWDSYAQDTDHFGVYGQRYRNNSAPTITDGQVFTIAENRPVGASVGTVAASDSDAGDSLTFAITGGNTGNAFAINSSTGKLTVNSVPAVNFELKSTFTLTIDVTDTANATASKAITVNLTDLNEAPFAFSKSFSLPENRPGGYVLGNITTTDQDAGQTLTYSITGGNTGNAFAINSSTGQLTVNNVAAVDFERNPTFNLQITATDNGMPQNSRTGLAVITVVNLNEKPRFVNQTIGNIAENSPNGTVVGTVRAVDQDVGQTLSYAISGGNPNNAFAINSSTGQVTVNNSAALDFETTPTFNVQITATDNGSPQQSSTATAVINLIDIPGAIRGPRLAAQRSMLPSLALWIRPTSAEQTLLADADTAMVSDTKSAEDPDSEPYSFLLTTAAEDEDSASAATE